MNTELETREWHIVGRCGLRVCRQFNENQISIIRWLPTDTAYGRSDDNPKLDLKAAWQPSMLLEGTKKVLSKRALLPEHG